MYYDEQSILCFGQAEEFLSKNSENSGWGKTTSSPGEQQFDMKGEAVFPIVALWGTAGHSWSRCARLSRLPYSPLATQQLQAAMSTADLITPLLRSA